MSHAVDSNDVSTIGLESSPVAGKSIEWFHRILNGERGIVVA